MKKRLVIIGASVLLLIAAWNTTWGRFYFEMGRCYNFSTLHEEYCRVAFEGMAPNWEKLGTGFEQFRKENPQSQDTVLYRLFKRPPWQVWNWITFFTHPRYQYPYLPPDQVKPRKKRDSLNSCGC